MSFKILLGQFNHGSESQFEKEKRKRVTFIRNKLRPLYTTFCNKIKTIKIQILKFLILDKRNLSLFLRAYLV